EFSTNLMPPKFRKDFHDLLDKMSLQVGSYIQGQIIVSFCIGILLFIGYSIIGLDYSLILASIAAVTSVVPYIGPTIAISPARSEEHTSELQSRFDLVCRLLLEKKKKKIIRTDIV